MTFKRASTEPLHGLRKWHRMFLKRYGDIGAYAYVLPGLLLYAAFFLWPLAHLVYLSTMKWNGIAPKVFVGAANYRELFSPQSKLWIALEHNVIWMAGAVVVPVAIALFLAVLLVRSRLYGRTIYRTVFFLPQVFSSVVVAIIWRWIYNPTYGALNGALRLLGLDALAQSWLGEQALALPALFIAWSWVHYGFCMVIFIAALQGIDEVYYDAAKVDGASALQQFWYVTLPLIQRQFVTVLLVTMIAAFQVFDLVFIITKGGPVWATLLLSVFMYDNAFKFSKVGYAAAIGVALGILILLLSLLFMQAKKKMEAWS